MVQEPLGVLCIQNSAILVALKSQLPVIILELLILIFLLLLVHITCHFSRRLDNTLQVTQSAECIGSQTDCGPWQCTSPTVTTSHTVFTCQLDAGYGIDMTWQTYVSTQLDDSWTLSYDRNHDIRVYVIVESYILLR